MTGLQKLLCYLLPPRWAQRMREESMQWMLRCPKCNASRSVWEAGDIRWRAASKGKRHFARCPQCRKWCWLIVERRA